MHLRSLGYRTDLALLRLGGSRIEDRGDHLVIRSQHNPGHRWGNFLLLKSLPQPDLVDHWVEEFTREFPTADHVALGFDAAHGTVVDLAAFADRGFSAEASTVMTASTVHGPRRPNTEANYRTLTSDADWDQLVELRTACDEVRLDASSHRDFVLAQVATIRRLTETGKGAWFGGFVDGRLLSGMGLFRVDRNIARFQSVETHPEARGRGLAGTLLHHVAGYGFDVLGTRTLVIVADPEYPAIRLYRAVGFAEIESQLQAERSSTA